MRGPAPDNIGLTQTETDLRQTARADVAADLSDRGGQKRRRGVGFMPSRRLFWWFLPAAVVVLIALTVSRLLTEQSRLRAQLAQSQAALKHEREVEQELRERQQKSSEQIRELSKELRSVGLPELNSLISDVYPSRFWRTSEGASNEVTVRAGAKAITLLLHSSGGKVYQNYRLEIRNRLDAVLWQRGGLVRQPTGEYVVTLPTKFLATGNYTLQVFASKQGQEVPLEKYSIHIAIREHTTDSSRPSPN